jgi:acetate kinase
MLLTVNTGSSSVRLAAFTPDLKRLADAHDRDAGGAAPRLRAFLHERGICDITTVAHRVVHGGATLIRPCVVDKEVEAEIAQLASLAPLHNPVALEWIRACRDVLGNDVTQVAVFDTAFYAHLPERARRYALPRALCEKHGLRRYGFHGLAHEAMWRRWRVLRPDVADGGRVISLQLGAGCSITAVKHGNPIDTSMGFTPLEGLVMATRSGDVDPGLLAFLQRVEALTPEQMENLLTRDSGLLGMAGEDDMQALLARDDGDAKLAIEVYCYRVRKYIGAYFAALGGVDALLFGGGVGEHAALIRSKILTNLEALGIDLDESVNRTAVGAETRISRDNSRVDVWAIRVDEAQILARAALDLLTRNTIAQGVSG